MFIILQKQRTDSKLQKPSSSWNAASKEVQRKRKTKNKTKQQPALNVNSHFLLRFQSYCFSQQKEPTTKVLKRRSYNRIRTNNNLSVISQLLKANKIKPLARFKTLNIPNSLLWRTHWAFHRVNDLWQAERTVYYSKIVLHALECRTARTFISPINPKPGEQIGQRKKPS